MAIILSKDMIYSTMEGIVPSRCRLTTRHLGATLFKSRLHASLMSLQACIMTLGGYQLLLSTIQGTQVFVHNIEGSIAQLVKHKALNLVDVGSSPTMEDTL